MDRSDRAATVIDSNPGLGARASQQVATSARLRISLFLMGLLLLYLIVRQIMNPGFSEYWGYSVVQLVAAMGLVVALSVFLSDRGGISVLSQTLLVVAIYADTLGTAEDFYHRFAGYDKVIHLLGSAAVTSIIGDVLVAFKQRGSISWSARRIVLVAAGIAIGGGILWEVYEYLGDTVLNTGRHISAIDTEYDLVSDTVGGIVGGMLISWQYFRSGTQPATDQLLRVPDDGLEDTIRRPRPVSE